MDINLDNLDVVTQDKYKIFQEKVEELLSNYQEQDKYRFDLVKEKIKQTNGNWDTCISLINDGIKNDVNISQLLAYEYCLAGEIITKGKVSFESMLDKLFNGIQKFRIGNPVPGMDDECLYGKSYDDETAIPVTSKLYRIVMPAGAQHLEYFKDDKPVGAVFIYEKGVIKEFAQDENGNNVDMKNDGIDFKDLREGQSLLTNLRQTVFHEWTHNAEKEIIEEKDDSIDYEYQGEDGKKYRNYQKINSYVTLENGTFQEPQYIISTQKDENGNRKRYFKTENGELRQLKDLNFWLKKEKLNIDKCVSFGLETRVIKDNGEIEMHNIITEGFVEGTARAMIRAIDPQVKDIDEGKYPEYVAIANSVITARDNSLGDEGQTYADFLINSSVLKKDLESRTVILDNDSKVDGLHYISNYANNVQKGRTRKASFYRNMPNVVSKLNLSEEQIDIVKKSNILEKMELTKDEQEYLRVLLVGGNPNNEMYAETVISDFLDILDEQRKFYDGIAEKLGYTDRRIEKTKSTQKLGQETFEEQNDISLLDEIENAQVMQERTINNRKNNPKEQNI